MGGSTVNPKTSQRADFFEVPALFTINICAEFLRWISARLAVHIEKLSPFSRGCIMGLRDGFLKSP
jgi:hypothetical protein